MYFYTTCDKECIMATRVLNPTRYQMKEAFKYVLMYTRTHLTRSDVPLMLWYQGCVILALGSRFVLCDFFIYVPSELDARDE